MCEVLVGMQKGILSKGLLQSEDIEMRDSNSQYAPFQGPFLLLLFLFSNQNTTPINFSGFRSARV